MDYFFHNRNPNFQTSSVVTTNNKSSGKEVERKMRNKRPNSSKMSTKVKLSTDPQSVAARERRQRISEKFKILRSLIPGGDTKNMDTVSMLEEAIQYVKHLKSQIWLHQTMISFENLDATYDHHDVARNSTNYNHQDFTSFDHFYDENYHHEMLPQLGFAEGSSFKVEDEDQMVSLSHDHHHHHHYGIYP